ncbi:MAG TPA: HWE histidine kinase domain-containing protein [Stenotrophomonas sp.]|jgi:PAS domain S-box-containing protein
MNGDEQYRHVLDTMRQGYIENEIVRDVQGKAVDYRVVAANPQYERLTGTERNSATGRLASEVVPGLETEWTARFDEVVRSGRAARFEERVAALDRWYEVHAFPLEGDRFAVLYDDITDRKDAEQALRESEQRFKQFGEASSAGLWVREAATLMMEYASPALGTIYGIETEKMLGGVELWAALIVPEDREVALSHLHRARDGCSSVHEFRIQRPSDLSFRWIRDTDFPLRDESGQVQRIGGIAEDVTDAKLLVGHQAVLLAELQHRVRNIMAMIRSITARTAIGAEDVARYVELLQGRLMALARVQALLTRAASQSVDLATVISDEVSVQAGHRSQYELTGPSLMLSPKASEVVTLAIHELATNAMKYGALSVPGGCVRVNWRVLPEHDPPWVSIEWTEHNLPAPKPSDGPRRRGFGSELIEARVPYELRGRGKLDITAEEVRCVLEFPLHDRASILETDAPPPTLVFGGAIDMGNENTLDGERILVLEDDYYLATDAARALRGAGAEVLGPCRSEPSAIELIDKEPPSAAVLDINLGAGPSFRLARQLQTHGVPFCFVTGYDADVIPPELLDVPRLQKPVDLRELVNTIEGWRSAR